MQFVIIGNSSISMTKKCKVGICELSSVSWFPESSS